MKTLLTLFIALFTLMQLSAQVPPRLIVDESVPVPDDDVVVIPPDPINDTDEIVLPPDAIDPGPDTNPYMFVDEPPVFPGGDSAWNRYVNSVMSYPADPLAAGQQGTVYVQFVVETDGSVTNVVVRKHPNSQQLADEAKRIVSSSPKWIPGKQNGRAVRVQMIQPIRFKLNSER
jgi:periplasmic protein TonB